MDYSRLTFPEYQFREYPKWIRLGEADHLVEDAKHEAELRKSYEKRAKAGK